jgi:hypothetical protein
MTAPHESVGLLTSTTNAADPHRHRDRRILKISAAGRSRKKVGRREEDPMGRKRSDAEQQIAELLQTAKKSLQLSVAFLSRLDGTTQHLEVVESSIPFLFRDGITQRQESTFCQAILDGKLPAVIPDVTAFPEAMKLPTAKIPRIRSYVSTPVVLSDGSLYGTFCAFGLTSDKELTTRDKSLMDVLASAAAVIIEPELRSQERRTEIEDRLEPLLADGGPVVVLQPLVDLASGVRVGAEALSRFPADWGKAPDARPGTAPAQRSRCPTGPLSRGAPRAHARTASATSRGDRVVLPQCAACRRTPPFGGPAPPIPRQRR